MLKIGDARAIGGGRENVVDFSLQILLLVLEGSAYHELGLRDFDAESSQAAHAKPKSSRAVEIGKACGLDGALTVSVFGKAGCADARVEEEGEASLDNPLLADPDRIAWTKIKAHVRTLIFNIQGAVAHGPRLQSQAQSEALFAQGEQGPWHFTDVAGPESIALD